MKIEVEEREIKIIYNGKETFLETLDDNGDIRRYEFSIDSLQNKLAEMRIMIEFSRKNEIK